MKRLILLVGLVFGINASAQEFGTFKFSWVTNGLNNVKEYRVYSTFGGVTNKFDLLAVTTNNFVVISNQVHMRRIMFATSVSKDGKESMPSRLVSFPRETPESPKSFDYEYKMNRNDFLDYRELPISPSRPILDYK